MNNQETQATLGTRHRTKTNSKQKKNKQKKTTKQNASLKIKHIDNTDLTKNRKLMVRRSCFFEYTHRVQSIKYLFCQIWNSNQYQAGSMLYSHNNWLFGIIVLRHTHIHSVAHIYIIIIFKIHTKDSKIDLM